MSPHVQRVAITPLTLLAPHARGAGDVARPDSGLTGTK
jgi:hypothetical protein